MVDGTDLGNEVHEADDLRLERGLARLGLPDERGDRADHGLVPRANHDAHALALYDHGRVKGEILGVQRLVVRLVQAQLHGLRLAREGRILHLVGWIKFMKCVWARAMPTRPSIQ